MEYLIRFVQVHETFRKPELEALAALAGIQAEFLKYSLESPYCVVKLQNDTAARKLVQRSILCDAVYELWGVGTDYDKLHQDVRLRTKDMWLKYRQASFRFSVHGFKAKRTIPEQERIIESFSYLGFEGPIKMRGADCEFAIHEAYEHIEAAPTVIYFGRFVSASERPAVTKYDLKKRKYISTTSMDSELALVTANMALAAPGKLVFDPFVGTGSFPIACAHFGALALGSDIDGRAVRGSKDKNIRSNFAQYCLQSLWLDALVSDLTNTPLRACRFLDAIVCDPPYGVREGLKVLGMRNGNPTEAVYIDGVASYLRPEYVPPKKPYSFDAMLDDILEFAAQTLVNNGRLCMWMPTANDDDVELAIPQHPALQLLAVSVQDFRRWARRLLTYSRRPDDLVLPLRPKEKREIEVGRSANELNKFRRKFFEGFKEVKEAQRNPKNERQ